jgi:hypothetical protein
MQPPQIEMLPASQQFDEELDFELQRVCRSMIARAALTPLRSADGYESGRVGLIGACGPALRRTL